MGDDFPVEDMTDEIEIIFDGEEETDDDDKATEPVEDVRGLNPVASPEVADGDDDVAEIQPEKSELEQIQDEMAELRESYLRKLAEFDNFRKRTDRERVELRRTAGEDMARELVPVLDNFERALLHSGEPAEAGGDDGAFRMGVEMIARQLKDTLERLGLEIIHPLGEPFQPELHEALQRVEDAEHPPGTVVAVLANGYRFGGKLIRPAMVSVSVENSETPAEAEPVEVHDAEGETF